MSPRARRWCSMPLATASSRRRSARTRRQCTSCTGPTSTIARTGTGATSSGSMRYRSRRCAERPVRWLRRGREVHHRRWLGRRGTQDLAADRKQRPPAPPSAADLRQFPRARALQSTTQSHTEVSRMAARAVWWVLAAAVAASGCGEDGGGQEHDGDDPPPEGLALGVAYALEQSSQTDAMPQPGSCLLYTSPSPRDS